MAESKLLKFCTQHTSTGHASLGMLLVAEALAQCEMLFSHPQYSIPSVEAGSTRNRLYPGLYEPTNFCLGNLLTTQDPCEGTLVIHLAIASIL